jgi:Uma2 family endonuclease
MMPPRLAALRRADRPDRPGRSNTCLHAMGQAALNRPMTAAEFLAWDATQTVRHEFVDGEVYAMVGNHESPIAVTLNIAFALREHLRGGRCRVYATEMKLHVGAANAFFYPEAEGKAAPTA